MVRNNIGSVVVTDEGGKPVGIVTERDILKSIAYRRSKTETKVEEIMSKPLISVASRCIAWRCWRNYGQEKDSETFS